jgi:hypothetical protein
LISYKTITCTEFDSYDQSYMLIESSVNPQQFGLIPDEWFAQADDGITLARRIWRKRGGKANG